MGASPVRRIPSSDRGGTGTGEAAPHTRQRGGDGMPFPTAATRSAATACHRHRSEDRGKAVTAACRGRLLLPERAGGFGHGEEFCHALPEKLFIAPGRQQSPEAENQPDEHRRRDQFVPVRTIQQPLFPRGEGGMVGEGGKTEISVILTDFADVPASDEFPVDPGGVVMEPFAVEGLLQNLLTEQFSPFPQSGIVVDGAALLQTPRIEHVGREVDPLEKLFGAGPFDEIPAGKIFQKPLCIEIAFTAVQETEEARPECFGEIDAAPEFLLFEDFEEEPEGPLGEETVPGVVRRETHGDHPRLRQGVAFRKDEVLQKVILHVGAPREEEFRLGHEEAVAEPGGAFPAGAVDEEIHTVLPEGFARGGIDRGFRRRKVRVPRQKAGGVEGIFAQPHPVDAEFALQHREGRAAHGVGFETFKRDAPSGGNFEAEEIVRPVGPMGIPGAADEEFVPADQQFDLLFRFEIGQKKSAVEFAEIVEKIAITRTADRAGVQQFSGNSFPQLRAGGVQICRRRQFCRVEPGEIGQRRPAGQEPGRRCQRFRRRRFQLRISLQEPLRGVRGAGEIVLLHQVALVGQLGDIPAPERETAGLKGCPAAGGAEKRSRTVEKGGFQKRRLFRIVEVGRRVTDDFNRDGGPRFGADRNPVDAGESERCARRSVRLHVSIDPQAVDGGGRQPELRRSRRKRGQKAEGRFVLRPYAGNPTPFRMRLRRCFHELFRLFPLRLRCRFCPPSGPEVCVAVKALSACSCHNIGRSPGRSQGRGGRFREEYREKD